MNDEQTNSITGIFAAIVMLGVASSTLFYVAGREEGKDMIMDQAIKRDFGEYKIGENKKVIFVWHTNLAKTK